MKLRYYFPKVSVKELEYPPIELRRAGEHRPFWSVMIPTYNRADYVERALRSVLEQDPGPGEMQIEVVDDCSTREDIEGVVRRLDSARISFYRQPQNVGLSLNWTTCIQRARGRYVHILHDDDMVAPGFYAEYQRFLEAHPETMLLFCRAIGIGEHDQWQNLLWSPPGWNDAQHEGVLPDALRELIKRDFIVCPTVVVPRAAYEAVGGFAVGEFYTVDWEMWLRLAARGAVAYIHQPPLYFYRMHGDAETNRLSASGRNIEEIVSTAERGVMMLPVEEREAARAVARRNAAGDATTFRMRLHEKRNYGAGLYYAVWALRLQPSPRNLMAVVKSALRAGASRLRGRNDFEDHTHR